MKCKNLKSFLTVTENIRNRNPNVHWDIQKYPWKLLRNKKMLDRNKRRLLICYLILVLLSSNEKVDNLITDKKNKLEAKEMRFCIILEQRRTFRENLNKNKTCT